MWGTQGKTPALVKASDYASHGHLQRVEFGLQVICTVICTMAEQHLEAKIKDIKTTRKPLVVLLKGTAELLALAIAQKHVQ